MSANKRASGYQETRRLSDLRSVGQATVADLERIGITSVAQLTTEEPDALYRKLCRVTGHRHDICARDVFAAAIAQACDPSLPREKGDWWYWSRLRKSKQERDRVSGVPVGSTRLRRAGLP